MTELAIITCGWWIVLWAFAPGYDSVMTTETGTDDRTVIDSHHRYPVASIVAVLAASRGRYMSRVFPLCNPAVMTADAIAGYLYMIKFPAQRNMAGIADITARDMSGILSLCDNIVVATRTAAVHGGMINSNNVAPQSGRMTIVAITDNPYMLAGWGARFYPP